MTQMRIRRRDLLRHAGTAAAATALYSTLTDSALAASGEPARLIRLDRNENAYGPCEKAKAAFQEAFTEANRYPGEDVEQLRAAIALSHRVKPENVTLGCGSTEIFRMAAEAYLGRDKNVVMASPSFEPIANAARLVGAEVRGTPLNHVYGHDLDAMRARADSATGLLYICNPNNPTGTLTPKSELEAFLTKLPGGLKVLMDEAYHEYVGPTSAYASWVERAAVNPQLIITRTFSKAYGLAGLRLGYAVSSKETAKRLAAQCVPMDVNAVAAKVALAALSDQAYVKKIARRNEDDRQEFFNQANARMLRCLDSQTNFVLMRTGSTGKEAMEMLRGKGVLVAADYPSFEKHIRVTLGQPQEMQAFWQAWDETMPHHPM